MQSTTLFLLILVVIAAVAARIILRKIFVNVGAQEIAIKERRYTGATDFPQHYSSLAHHWENAEVWQSAIDYLDKAGERALRTFSNREAVELFLPLDVVVDEQPAPAAGTAAIRRPPNSPSPSSG